jgi:ABC-2 type transport system ATP-binding protein
VSQTCDRVVIINKGRVVAEDTPANLTRRLRGSETIFIQVDAARAADAAAALAAVPGVVRVAPADNTPGAVEVDSESGRDVRRELARAAVLGGHDLIELRPLRVSLEEIFLSLTTEEKVGEAEA